MPYYRILIWTKKRKAPYQGIKLVGDSNINSVYNYYREQSVSTYRNDFIDIEVQMLSKLCTAVKEFEKKEQ